MTDDDFDAAAQLLADAFDAQPIKLVKAKCPRCRRWCLRSSYALTLPCVMCADIGEPFAMFDLLLMVEFRLSWNAYQTKLERDGAPWVNPKAWAHSRARRTEWQRRHGTGRQSDQQT